MVPMCSVTPLVSWNQTIFFGKKKKKKKKPFVSLIGISGILYCVIFVKKGINSPKIEHFCSKRE